MMKNTIIFDLDGTLVQISPIIKIYIDREVLLKLKAKYNLALVTGSSKKEVVRILKIAKIKDFFTNKNTVTANEIPQSKSTGKPFLKILEKVSGNSIVIGDSVGDKIGSKMAGIPFIKVRQSKSIENQKKYLNVAIKKGSKLLENFKIS